MSDLISREAAIDAVADLYWMDERLLNFKKEIDATFDKIKALPSAQPEPRPKRGKWVDVMTEEWCTFDECKCSVCGVVEYFNKGWKKFSYCPNCGANMERSEE